MGMRYVREWFHAKWPLLRQIAYVFAYIAIFFIWAALMFAGALDPNSIVNHSERPEYTLDDVVLVDGYSPWTAGQPMLPGDDLVIHYQPGGAVSILRLNFLFPVRTIVRVVDKVSPDSYHIWVSNRESEPPVLVHKLCILDRVSTRPFTTFDMTVIAVVKAFRYTGGLFGVDKMMTLLAEKFYRWELEREQLNPEPWFSCKVSLLGRDLNATHPTAHLSPTVKSPARIQMEYILSNIAASTGRLLVAMVNLALYVFIGIMIPIGYAVVAVSELIVNTFT